MKLDALVSANEKAPAGAPGLPGGAKAVVDFFTASSAIGALHAGIEQSQQGVSAERAKQEISRQLLKLEVSSSLQEELLKCLSPWGFQFTSAVAPHPYGKPDYTYTALQRNDWELALAQLPRQVFDTDSGGDFLHLSDFAKMLKAFREKKTRLFSEGVEGIRFAFKAAISDEAKGADWKFIAWADVVSLREAKLEFWQAFELEKPGPGAPPAAARPKSIDVEIDNIVEVLVRLVANDYPSPDAAFRDLVMSSGWPDEWKNARLASGGPNDARAFLSFIMAKKTFPAGHPLAGQNVLGEFLRKLLARNTLGGEDADALARIVVDCALVNDPEAFKKYYKT